jgi:hypothetical protein
MILRLLYVQYVTTILLRVCHFLNSQFCVMSVHLPLTKWRREELWRRTGGDVREERRNPKKRMFTYEDFRSSYSKANGGYSRERDRSGERRSLKSRRSRRCVSSGLCFDTPTNARRHLVISECREVRFIFVLFGKYISSAGFLMPAICFSSISLNWTASLTELSRTVC